MPIIPNDTLSYVVNLVHRANLDVISELPLSHAAFNLDSSGVAGFFSGESAVRATATVNLVAHRRWFGWYNAPGSYEVARQYSGLARAHLFDALFPSSDSNPAKILMVDGRVGPEYSSLYSTTSASPSTIEHLGSLIVRKVSQMSIGEELSRRRKGAVEPARVTFVKLNRKPLHEINELKLVPSSSIIIFGISTILISFGGCIGCFLVGDWFCLASIALGIIANGIACAVIGSGKLCLKHNPPAQVDTPGDVLLRTDTDIIVLVGNEGFVSPITHGRFDLRFRGMPGFNTQPVSQSVSQQDSQPVSQQDSQPVSQSQTPSTASPTHFIPLFSQPRISQKYLIDLSVILLLSQFLAQLLLIPQGTLFGQLILDLQTHILFNRLSIVENEDIYQYELKNWTEAVVFACLFFRAIHPLPKLEESEDAGQNPEDWRKRVNTKAAEADAAKKEQEEADKEAAKKQKEAENAQAEAEAALEMAGATVAAAAIATAAAGAAKKAAESAQTARQTAAEKAADKAVVYGKKEKDKENEVKRAEEAEREYTSFQNFLDALLQHKTDVWQAFTESLVRKIGETNVDPYARDRPPPFKFVFKDTLVTVPEGQNTIANRDLRMLSTCQKDAYNALIEWKHFCDITNINIQGWHD